MLLPITAFYAGILSIFLIVLAALVVRQRWRARVGLGDGGDKYLLRAVRIHGNAAEYIPIALILLGLAELNRATPLLLHGSAIVLIFARLAHAWGLSSRGGVSPGRTVGVAATWGVIVLLAVVNILLSWPVLTK